ncbi:conserved hypothetical protein [Leishmania braziliensis MHOM/BR/75/M2904]|uniref:Protein HGH1 homolog n=2 Tax=Leishmania braziliensis TaxID=5660 RepID=A4HLR7_LEIBR|nr:conserved hypothetical protein [Leishmania braziliensis MHOM/BR/75/M2904]KAI5687051.1 hypothetical protein MNV84_07095 [Leishmania braziliensis]CAJ2479548.1 unnamed protein product [Leishmania braziliensis]CAM40763.1 conserved hypothetical protein [Leishmania braziliensis MHOM/BR/75/M2904]SYZ69175.1 hypothetical_protein [Leishmania braziliensis MHOM/BR/75/M2904]
MASVSLSVSPVTGEQTMPSADTIQQFQETFSFVRHEREDVRKMAIHGIAEHSKENRDLYLFLASAQYGPSCTDALLQCLHPGGKLVLGDILTILINCSADGSCAEMLVQRKVVRKAMRLLDGMARSDQPESYVRSILELTLMLLNNLTASHVTAIDDLLQKNDEDMRGFYLGKLQVYYERFVSAMEAARSVVNGEAAAEVGEDAAKKTDHAASDDGEDLANPKHTSLPATSHRDLSRWILHILLNVTRTLDGQELLLEDSEWRGTLSSSLSSPNPRHRYLAAQCYCNCSCSPKPLYSLILKSDALVTAVERLNCKEPIEDIQKSLAEFIASMLESEDGMARLESVNAKKVLAGALDVSKAAHAAKVAASASCVEVVEEDGSSVAATPAVTLAPSVSEFLERSVLPYLDDIMDAYIAPGSDELD